MPWRGNISLIDIILQEKKMALTRRREVSLLRNISRQCNCSRRSVYLLDEHFDFPTDYEFDGFIASVQPTEFNWAHEIHDCDDIAREVWTKCKMWFKARGLNVASGFIWRQRTSISPPHAFNFYIRKSDLRLIFIDRLERVPLAGRAHLVVM